jgi:hypothetical protein
MGRPAALERALPIGDPRRAARGRAKRARRGVEPAQTRHDAGRSRRGRAFAKGQTVSVPRRARAIRIFFFLTPLFPIESGQKKSISFAVSCSFSQIDRALDCLLQQQLQNSNLPRADLQNPIDKLQPICSNLFDLTTARMMNNQQINLAVSNPVI